MPQEAPAPLAGWNTRDPFEAMEPTDAILLDNWFPDFQGLTSRGGSLTFAAGLDAAASVQTLATFTSGAAKQFLAACGGKIFDISSGMISSPLASGFTSDIWQTVMFNGHSIWVNGSDPAQIYDGTTITATGFTGANMNLMTVVGVFNNRLYFWTGADPSFYYGPVLGISGALSNFPLSLRVQVFFEHSVSRARVDCADARIPSQNRR